MPTPSLQPPGHTHRFSGSELKGSAWINNRLMTELPGKEPDMPARISVGKLTTGKSVINNKQKTGNFNLGDKMTGQNMLTRHSLWKANSNSAFFDSRRLSSLNKKGFWGCLQCFWLTGYHLRPAAQLYRQMEMGNRSVFTAVAFLFQGETCNILASMSEREE